MNVHAPIDLKWPGLTRPNGDPLRLNHTDFIAIDRHKDTTYEATYRPQALYSRANEGFHANNEIFLLHEVSTNLPIYLPDTGRCIGGPCRGGRLRPLVVEERDTPDGRQVFWLPDEHVIPV